MSSYIGDDAIISVLEARQKIARENYRKANETYKAYIVDASDSNYDSLIKAETAKEHAIEVLINISNLLMKARKGIN